MCETAEPFGEKRETNIFLRIRKKMPSLSVSHRIIAELILNKCSEVVKMSSHDIARELKISPSTIVRFAVEIGYSGFREMMSDLQSTVFNYSQAPMQKLRDSIRENEPLETILQKVVEQGVENLELRKFTPLNDTFMKVVRFMIDAEKIYLIGARSSYCVVQYGGFYLSTIAKNISYFSSSSETRYEQLNELTEKDIVFAVSFHRYFKDTVDATAFAKKKHAFVVGITDSILSPIANYCDELLLVPSTASFSSYIPSIALMEALVLAFTQAKSAEAKKVLDERMVLLLENNVYAEMEYKRAKKERRGTDM